jgi:hypothetical protein
VLTTAFTVAAGHESAMTCGEAKNIATNASAATLIMAANVHNEGRAPLLRASLSIVLLGSFVIEPLAVLFA